MIHVAKPTVYRKVRYRSKFEAAIAEHLENAGIPFRYEEERLPYELPCITVMDFTLPHGVLVEAKGFFSRQDRRKLLEVKRSNPAADIRLLFQRADRKLGKGPQSATYGQWATKYGFPWAEGPVIPESWILG